MQIAIEPTDERWLMAFKASITEGIAVYDAVYIAASLTLNAKLITRDEMLAQRLSKNEKQKVVLLNDLNF